MGALSSYLLDTCTFIWLCSEPERLSTASRRLIDKADASLLLSDVSALEITLKWTSGKIVLPDPPRHWIERQISTWALQCLALSRADVHRAAELPEYHRDPFDRLLVAAALNSDATILTPDKAVRRYPVSCRW